MSPVSIADCFHILRWFLNHSSQDAEFFIPRPRHLTVASLHCRLFHMFSHIEYYIDYMSITNLFNNTFYFNIHTHLSFPFHDGLPPQTHFRHPFTVYFILSLSLFLQLSSPNIPLRSISGRIFTISHLTQSQIGNKRRQKSYVHRYTILVLFVKPISFEDNYAKIHYVKPTTHFTTN